MGRLSAGKKIRQECQPLAKSGYAIRCGVGRFVYIYGEAGYGKGSTHQDSTRHSNTRLDADRISLKSTGDTTLNGAQATAERIDADVGGQLSVISPQDSENRQIEQMGVGGRVQASLGTAWQASGNYSSSEANGQSNSVKQQTGLFAGDGGYHVKADSVDLQGGAIVSTAKKENNDLTANSLTFSDIQNRSAYDAKSVGLSGGTSSSFNKDKSGTGTQTTQAANPTNNENWRNATSFSPVLPQYESDKDSSVTRATLSEGNITIGGQKTTTTALGIHHDAATAHRSVDTLPNLQEILDKQKSIADATSTIAAATRTYSQNQQQQAEAEKQRTEQTAIAELQARGGKEWDEYRNSTSEAEKQDILKNNSESYKSASDQARAWGMGGDKSRALNAVTMAVTGALGGQTDVQVAANTLAPYVAQEIGEQFGHGEDKNTAAQLVNHAILGAALAYVNGGNPTAGGSAAVASEAAADYLAKRYNDGKTAINPQTGQFDPNLLPEDAKTQIRDLTAAIGAVVGGTVGDSAFNAQLAGVVGQNAVENNALENVLMPHEIDEIKNDKTGQYGQEQLQAIKDNSTYKINGDGDFIVCIKVAGYSCAPRVGERYATEKEILEKGGETIATTAVSWGAAKLLEPIVVVASKSGVWTKVTDTVQGWFGKNKIDVNQNQIIKNAEDVKEIKVTDTPLEGQARLNTKDVGGNGKLNPAEAATAAQLEKVLGKMERAPAGADYDFITASGKKVDIIYSTKNLSQKEIDGLNKFYEKNMTQSIVEGSLPPGKQQIIDHLNKADVVPVDFRVLDPHNQVIFNDFMKSLSSSQREKILIVR